MYYKYSQEGQSFIIQSPNQYGVPLWIPIDPDNTDYQKFLIYLEENNLTINDIPVWEP